MATWTYVASDAAGKDLKGNIDAGSREEAINILKNQGLALRSIKEVGAPAKPKAKTPASAKGKKKGGGINLNINLGPSIIKDKDLTILTRQMAILLDAGLPLIRSLKTLARQATNPVVRTTLEETAVSVEGGSTFSSSCSSGGVEPPLDWSGPDLPALPLPFRVFSG